MSFITLIASGIFGGLASILLRLAALRSDISMFHITPLLLRGSALLSYGIGFILYALALRKVNLGTAYPLMVAVSIFIVFTFTAVHENILKPTQIIGALIILLGIWLVMK